MALSGRPYGARESLCDNAAVVAILKSGRSKDKRVLHRIDLYMGKTATDICPVKAMLNYLVVRGKRPGPLFGDLPDETTPSGSLTPRSG